MLVCDLEPNGSAPWELLRKYGGKFGLLEKIKKGGVGSPKIKYISGLEEVDEFVKETAGDDIPHLNFEYLKNGILVRVNKTQYLKGVLMTYDEINLIELIISEKMMNNTSLRQQIEKINMKSATLEIISAHGQSLHCEVSVQNYLGLKKYFENNKSVRGKFESKITK